MQRNPMKVYIINVPNSYPLCPSPCLEGVTQVLLDQSSAQSECERLNRDEEREPVQKR